MGIRLGCQGDMGGSACGGGSCGDGGSGGGGAPWRPAPGPQSLPKTVRGLPPLMRRGRGPGGGGGCTRDQGCAAVPGPLGGGGDQVRGAQHRRATGQLGAEKRGGVEEERRRHIHATAREPGRAAPQASLAHGRLGWQRQQNTGSPCTRSPGLGSVTGPSGPQAVGLASSRHFRRSPPPPPL